MTTTLSEGVKVPDVGSVNWAGDLEVNWNLLNGALANLSGNVKLDRDNTWTGEQSFTLPIVGSITGTASKAVADEDGTSIKTGYGKLAGSQTWSGENQWGTNLLTVKDSAFTKGTTVTDRKQNLWKFTDSNDSVFGIWEAIQYTSGIQGIRLNVTNKYKNGALDPTGNDVPVYFEFLQKESDGQTILKWANGLIDNGIFPLAPYGLGNAAYQWSSVYAQTYYYNGTAWGLDKSNVWTNTQEINTGTNATDIYFESYHGQEEYNTYGTSNFKNYNCFLRRDTSRFDNSIGIYRSVGRLGDTEVGATVHDIDTSFAYYDIHIAYKYMNIMGNTQFRNDGTSNLVIPTVTDTTDLGTSTNKWKTLNGINPGALSLPDLDSAIDITTSFEASIDKTQNVNSYTADFTGWLHIIWWTEGLTRPYHIYAYCTNSASDSDLLHSTWGQTFSMPSAAYFVFTVIPVVSGKTYWFETSFTRESTDSKRLAYKAVKVPCLGNV